MALDEKSDHPLTLIRCLVVTGVLLLGGMPVLAQDGDGSAPPAEEPAPENPVERFILHSASDAGALARRYPHMAVWLEPEAAPRELALVEREAAGQARGALLVLAGEGQSANDPLLEGLRHRFSRAGWAAMTLGLERPSQALQVARDRLAMPAPTGPGDMNRGDNADASVMIDVNQAQIDDLLEAHRKRSNARLRAAVDWLTERGYERVAIAGVGRGAEAVHQFLPEAPAAVTDAIWILADFGRSPAEQLSESAVTGMPILDLRSSLQDGDDARWAAFRRSGTADYQRQAVAIPARADGRAAGAVANRMLGWLDAR